VTRGWPLPDPETGRPRAPTDAGTVIWLSGEDALADTRMSDGRQPVRNQTT
jgi:hypothetical protein